MLDIRSVNVIPIIIINTAIPAPPYKQKAQPAECSPQSALSNTALLPHRTFFLSQAAPISLGSNHLEFDPLSPAIKGNVIQLKLGVSVMGPQKYSRDITALLSPPKIRHHGSVSGEKIPLRVRTRRLI